MIGEEVKRHYVLIKDFNNFIYDHTLHCRKKDFRRYCLQAFRMEEILKHDIEYRFMINDKQIIIMLKKGEYVKLRNCERKIKSLSIIYADFEIILVTKDNGKQNPEGSYTNIKNLSYIKNILLAVMTIN